MPRWLTLGLWRFESRFGKKTQCHKFFQRGVALENVCPIAHHHGIASRVSKIISNAINRRAVLLVSSVEWNAEHRTNAWQRKDICQFQFKPQAQSFGPPPRDAQQVSSTRFWSGAIGTNFSLGLWPSCQSTIAFANVGTLPICFNLCASLRTAGPEFLATKAFFSAHHGFFNRRL